MFPENQTCGEPVESKLKTAVLGLNEAGKELLQAASGIAYFQVQAVADKDTETVEKIAKQYNCAGYDDYRQFLAANQFDCLLVAAPTYGCNEYIRTAIKKKFNILKIAPPARNFEEAVEFVRLAEAENIKFAVANPARFAQSFLALRQFLQENQAEQPFLITAVCNVGDQSHPAWQTDPKLAGGGVLLHNCYQIIDQIMWNFTTPQQVYSLNTNQATDRQQRLYLTEGTAVVTMKFTDTLFGSLIANKTVGPGEEVLKIYSKDKILTVSYGSFIVSDRLGKIIEEQTYRGNLQSCTAECLKNFAISILLPDKNRLSSGGAENLKNMAVLEAAYLSARTGMPEEPAKILQMANIEPTNILQVNKSNV